ncbi:hypothetical protein J2T12_000019 [Paenibacillus anaericanus]|uniref:hypothetical protein n=1 Tax=Paenibacillus TaxID=44249 RepID=UPI002787DB03|nr:hypothetical protein [Paenibacillus anaericanus]MDQ0086625.1 hypothetical protein [Paenibacillus anaericanus]
MNQTLHSNTEQINDYLDLLNYAKQIGDTSWQAEIVATLSKLNTPKTFQETSDANELLWRRFDQINTSLVELFNSIRETQDNVYKQQLVEKMWGLKLERISISRQIKSDYFQTEDLWFEE